ncbi:HupE/UreJ family protein [Hymenobacter sp.]|uniref:HupE/UreJ family protein n=1 Tax=Hymenobacter sp. TaxID=1898978 RepID=UPI00286D6727|nr:HupE/UreJ family protein [Hymenobacter sp.]
MESPLPLLFALIAGTGHAFEPDHLLAVGNLVSRRDTLAEALRDGVYWGLGHTTTLVIAGALILLGRVTFLTSGYFEAAVGLMLVVLGLGRLLGQRRPAKVRPGVAPPRVAYAVGLLHGLAGSGALVLLVMSEIRNPWLSVLYFAVFGLGSILGMFVVAGLCSVPFTRRMRISRRLKFTTVTLSSLLCIGYGGWMIWGNI